MIRVASLAFVLRAGVKYTSAKSGPSSHFRTVQARIDTIMYERLKIAQNDLFGMLQRIVFKSAGYLSREQVYPVALVFFQLLRILCIGASHLSNIVQRFQSKGSHPSPQLLPSSTTLNFKNITDTTRSVWPSKLPIHRPQTRAIYAFSTLPILEPTAT